MSTIRLSPTSYEKTHFWPLCRSLSLAFCVSLSACSSGGSGDGDGDSNLLLTPEQPAKGIALAEFTNPINLIEGASSIRVTVPIARADDSADSVQLRVPAEVSQRYPELSVTFQPETLTPDVDQFDLILSYGLSIAPIQPMEFELLLETIDNEDVQQATLTIDVTPTPSPDVYLLIGQSNMVGASEIGSRQSSTGQADAPDSRIRQLNVSDNSRGQFTTLADFRDPANNVGSPVVITAQDPLHELLPNNRGTKTGTQIGPALSFAKAALADTTSQIVLVPAAWGGTGFCGNTDDLFSWNASESGSTVLGGTGLYERAVARTNIALEQTGGILRGILWHQGEEDAMSEACSNLYAENLRLLASALRENIVADARGSEARGPEADIPFIAGTLSQGIDERGDFSITTTARQNVENALRSIESYIPLSALSIHDDLLPPAYPCGDTSCIHFGADAYREMGPRYYQALRGLTVQ